MHSDGKDLVLGVEVVGVLVAVDPQHPLELVYEAAGARPPLLPLHQAGVRPPHRPQPSLGLGVEHQTRVWTTSDCQRLAILQIYGMYVYDMYNGMYMACIWQKWVKNAEN